MAVGYSLKNVSRKEVTIIDTVTLGGLEVGTQYKLVGWQMLKEENAELLINGKRVKSDYTFTADSETMKVEVAYYVSGNVLEPIGRDYLYSELVNPIFTKDGDNVKVKVAVKFLDNQTKATQVSQYELVLHKDSNWKIVD